MGEGGTNDYHIQINSVTDDGNAYIDFGDPPILVLIIEHVLLKQWVEIGPQSD